MELPLAWAFSSAVSSGARAGAVFGEPNAPSRAPRGWAAAAPPPPVGLFPPALMLLHAAASVSGARCAGDMPPLGIAPRLELRPPSS